MRSSYQFALLDFSSYSFSLSIFFIFIIIIIFFLQSKMNSENLNIILLIFEMQNVLVCVVLCLIDRSIDILGAVTLIFIAPIFGGS